MSEPGRVKRVMAPRGKGRRTQEERNQLSTEEKARTQGINIQQQQQAAAERIEREKKARRGHLLGGRGRGAGRGGSHGRGGSLLGADPLGPLADGSIISPSRTRTFERPWAPSRRGRTGAAASWGPQRLKKEHPEVVEAVATASRTRRSTRTRDNDVEIHEIKDEDSNQDDGTVGDSDSHSSDSDPMEVSRKDIDFIDLISDDENAPQGVVEPKFLPFRALRVEHRDRKSQATTKTEDLELKTEDEEDIDAATSTPNRKGKSKLGELDTPRTIRHWAGVFPEEDLDPSLSGFGILKGPASTRQQNIQPPPNETRKQPLELHIKKRNFRDIPLGWHTQEQRDEWNRTLKMRDAVLDELAKPQALSTGHDDPHRDSQSVLADKKTNQVYLFQFPAVMPPLVLDSELARMPEEEKQQEASKWMDSLGPKRDETRPAPFVNNRPLHLPKAGGKVGKLRFYKSGRTEVDWGGLPFKLTQGIPPLFIQEAVLVRPNGDTGNAYSFGEIRGKYIVGPDLSQFFPKEESEED